MLSTERTVEVGTLKCRRTLRLSEGGDSRRCGYMVPYEEPGTRMSSQKSERWVR